MTLSIGHRLFLAIWLTVLAIGAISVELVRWKLLDNFATHELDSDTHFLDPLGAGLEAKYRLHHDWSFLPRDALAAQGMAARRVRALTRQRHAARPEVGRVEHGPSDRAARCSGRISRGCPGAPATVAFASIDRIARPLSVDGEPIGALVVARAAECRRRTGRGVPDRPAVEPGWVAAAALLLKRPGRGAARRLFPPADRRARRRRTQARERPVRRASASIMPTNSANSPRRSIAWPPGSSKGRNACAGNGSRTRRTSCARRWRCCARQMEDLQDGVRAATPQNIALMERQVASLNQLVDDLHELARSDLGQARYAKAPRRLAHRREVFDDFAMRLREAGLRASMRRRARTQHRGLRPVRLQQVFANLLENSARYTAAGGRVLLSSSVAATCCASASTTRRRAFPSPRSIGLASGSSAWTARAAAPRRRRRLGLALCRQIVAARRPRRVRGVRARRSAGSDRLAAGSPMSAKILIVEDESDLAAIITDYVVAAEFAAEGVADGQGRAREPAARPARPRRARPDAAGTRRPRAVPRRARIFRRADPDADRQSRGNRPPARPRSGCRRLRLQAVQPARTRRAHQGDSASVGPGRNESPARADRRSRARHPHRRARAQPDAERIQPVRGDGQGDPVRPGRARNCSTSRASTISTSTIAPSTRTSRTCAASSPPCCRMSRSSIRSTGSATASICSRMPARSSHTVSPHFRATLRAVGHRRNK